MCFHNDKDYRFNNLIYYNIRSASTVNAPPLISQLLFIDLNNRIIRLAKANSAVRVAVSNAWEMGGYSNGNLG